MGRDMKIRHIRYHADEYLSAIAGMPAAYQGVYWLICSLIYSTGTPLAVDDPRLHALCGCHGRTLSAALAYLETHLKITRNDSEIDVKRCRNEIETALKRSRKHAENGAKGNKIRWDTDRQAIPTEIALHAGNQEPVTIERKKAPADAGDKESSEPAAPLRGHTILSANGKSHDRGTRLALDWEPSDADCQFAIAAGLDPSAVTAEFRDYWIGVPGQRGRKIDWSATFRNSCRKAAERQRPRGNGSGHSSILAAVSAIRDP